MLARAPEHAARPARGLSAAAVRGLVLAVFVALLAVVIGVIFVLPDLVSEPAPVRPPAPDGRQTRARAPAAPGADQVVVRKSEAERVLGQVLRKQAVLESRQVSVWGADAYPDALGRVAAGDARFAERDFAGAAERYGDALAALTSLEASMPGRYAGALAAAAQALERGDGQAAQAGYRIALALEPQSEEAATGLQRAFTIERVLALIARAAEREQAGDLDAARVSYAEALELDPHARAAVEGGARVDALILERGFRDAMSVALSAFGRDDFRAARAALATARKWVPGSAEVSDLAARLDARMQLVSIKRLQAKAAALEAAEKWTEASGVYESVLKIDPGVAFAQEGRDRARALARLHAQIDGMLQRPERLRSLQPLEQAERVLAATAGASHGTVLQTKLTRLAVLVAQARTPVTVQLRSDGLTEVVVYRVGRLGTFRSRELRLRPGRYTAVGSRPGYRDVRREFEVAAGTASEPIVIQCEERI